MKKPGNNFGKFAKKKSNAAIKEQFKQEKRKDKKEREAFFDQKKAEARQRLTPNVNQQSGKKGQAPAPVSHLRKESDELMPLNKYIAHSGVAARREAAELVKQGLVKVNGETVNEPGFKVSPKDEVRVNGKKIFLAKNLVYILLNKPKDFITTTDDPQGRKTVLDIIARATTERVYPVGRLDRNTSGVLILTNDGELAQKLTM
jgi:23S rRNA pseudouridine2605 synthase